MNSSNRTVLRIRHDTRIRLLTVKRVTPLTPHMVRITLTGDLQGFISSAFDDHIKIFLPPPGSTTPLLPKGPPGSPAAESGPRPIMRDYTPRRYDALANELDIDFVLHDDGPATTWAAAAKPGDQLGIGGPRGSSVMMGQFDWHLLITDEAGLPAVGRRLEELDADTQVFVIAEVADASEQQVLTTQARFSTRWVHRGKHSAASSTGLLNALKELTLPSGEGTIWIATESSVARSLRRHLTDERGIAKDWIKAAAYWKQGIADAHERLDD